MRYFSSTVTRFDSVGWAVITGLMRKPDNSVWISSGAMPSLAASASTWSKVPRNAARPRVRSIWRRRRMAAFCSAIASSWNRMPWTWRARAICSGVKPEILAPPTRADSISGWCRRTTSSSS